MRPACERAKTGGENHPFRLNNRERWTLTETPEASQDGRIAAALTLKHGKIRSLGHRTRRKVVIRGQCGYSISGGSNRCEDGLKPGPVGADHDCLWRIEVRGVDAHHLGGSTIDEFDLFPVLIDKFGHRSQMFFEQDT